MLVISNFTFHYQDGEPLFDHAELQLDSGLWLLSGHNGSGKSTLLKLIEASPEAREKMGVLDESSIIVRSSELLFMNKEMGVPNHLKEIDFASYILKINDVRLSEPYKPLYDNKALGLYSTGEQKRVLFHILSYLKPGLLLIDEFISNLDEENLTTVIEQLEGMAEKGTIILVASNEEDIKKRFTHWVQIKNRKLEMIVYE